MGLAKLCGFLAGSVLLILLVDSTAEDCKRPEACSFPMVIKGTYQTPFKEREITYFKIKDAIKSIFRLKKYIKVSSTLNCYYPPADVLVKEYIVVGFIAAGVIECDENFTTSKGYPKETEIFKAMSNNACTRCHL
ncbi:UNVERIFIED_CONTAM: hypothetical protein K2H54_047569 [Gekko kuhli]